MKCFACGVNSKEWLYGEPIDKELAVAWNLSVGLKSLFNQREGTVCPSCGINSRAIGLAKGIAKYYGDHKSFDSFVNWANSKRLSVAEINSCHQLHTQLKKIKGLTFAEFGNSKDSEDIQNLSYKDNSFDLIIHSETLEHVPDPYKAILECRRVIKEDGVIIFTIPIVWNKKSLQRASIDKKKIVNLSPPAYHGFRKDDYIVFWEFGGDFLKKSHSKVLWADPKKQNYVFLSKKIEFKGSWYEIMKYRLEERYYELRAQYAHSK